jgi:hypothetical protein
MLLYPQFIERAEMASNGRKKVADISRIIPGNWGKVESGWLARPL